MRNGAVDVLPKVGTAISPVTFGMAGIIHTDPSTKPAHQEVWPANAFRMTPWTTRCSWRSDYMTVVTCQHVQEGKTRPGSFELPIPNVGQFSGVAFGQYFGGTSSDLHPETISHQILGGYNSAGPVSFRGINGLWVAVVWDVFRGEAHFARDCLGGQTIYVAQLPDSIVFATDLRAFHASGMLLNLDHDAIAQFLHYLYIPAPRTLVDGCVAVLPGSVLTIGVAAEQKKYAAPRFVRGRKLEDVRSIEREVERQLPAFEEKLLSAVADCIPNTGRIALTLSGGKDSSVLAVALSKICPERVLALTIGQGDERVAEVRDAALVCRTLGLQQQSYVPTRDDWARGVIEFARLQDQPVGDPAALPYFLGMSRLPDDCAVILDGTGNDSYFGIPGMDRGIWRYKLRVKAQNVTGPLWPLLLKMMSLGPLGLRRLSELWRGPVEEAFAAWEGWSAHELEQLFGRHISFADTYLWEVMRGGDPENWLELQTDITCGIWEPHTTYRKAVTFAQALGKSIRFPFTDNRLATFVHALPEPLQFKDGINKQILRAYMKRNLPREIVDKPKSGFVVDLNEILANPRFDWPNVLNRAGLLHVLPTWSRKSIQHAMSRYNQNPQDSHCQQRLYALCLLATVLAVKDGYDPWSMGGALSDIGAT